MNSDLCVSEQGFLTSIFFSFLHVFSESASFCQHPFLISIFLRLQYFILQEFFSSRDRIPFPSF